MNENMKKKNEAELNAEVLALKKEYFDLKISAATGQVSDNSQFRKIRVKIAQALTLLNMKKSGTDK
jgi:ribosomal protein L29